MSFAIYLVGTLILIGGLIYISHLLHIPQTWVIGLSVLLLGAGIMGGVSSTRQKDTN